MNNNQIKELYNKKVLPISKNPYHFEKIDNPDISILATNPICGDKFHLLINHTGSKIESAHFYGFGCALSKASTSLLVEQIEGLSIEQIRILCKQFLEVIQHHASPKDLSDELFVLLSLTAFEGRIDCIKLSWEALYNYLETTAFKK